MKFKSILISLLMCFSPVYLMAQWINNENWINSGLRTGDTMPDIILKNIVGFPAKGSDPVRISDFKGKLLIIDFWATSCSNCLSAFPKMEKLQQQFGDKIQILLINPYEDSAAISQAFEKIKKHRNIRMPLLPQVNGDSIWKKLFPTNTIPHHVWIDEDGIIIANTGGYNATPQNVSAVLSKQKTRMLLKPFNHRGFPEEAGSLSSIFEAKGLFPLAQTWISEYYEGEGVSPYGYQTSFRYDSTARVYRSTYINRTFIEIFRDVYRNGFQWPAETPSFLSNSQIVWQVPDSASFQMPRDSPYLDDWFLKNKFCMEISVPESQRDSLAGKTIAALNDFIGYRFGVKGEFVIREGSDEIILKITKR